MPSRLKGIETFRLKPSTSFRFPLDMPSRLKGIETFWDRFFILFKYPSYFGYAFPFEGNWNPYSHKTVRAVTKLLWICLPVWRELKPPPWWTRQSHRPLAVFGYAFPFEGNWNLDIPSKYPNSRSFFGYAFPFEGNWNSISQNALIVNTSLAIRFPVWRELKQPTPTDPS